jgi:hypothetical protein
MITEGKPGSKKLYNNLLAEIDAKPELLEPIDDPGILLKHKELVESLLSTIFPPSTSSSEELYAVTFPFKLETVYTSNEFRAIFLDEDNSMTTDRRTNVDISKASIALAYNVILNKFFSFSVPISTTSVHAFTDKETGLKKYYELNLNSKFVDVRTAEEYELPSEISPEDAFTFDELKEKLPLQQFIFEGLMVINVTDVTNEQVVAEIKNALININAFSEVAVYDELQAHLESLMELKGVKIGITPFFKKNDIYLYTETHYRNSILFRNEEVRQQKDRISDLCQEIFRYQNDPLLYPKLKEKMARYNELLKYYVEQGASSLILCPLKCDNGELIGLLEIMSSEAGLLRQQHLLKIHPAIPLFAIALEKTNESLQMQIDKTIKEHFTAIQPSVEWKFTEAAFRFLQLRQQTELAKMPTISFEDVYPLYGSIDIRNSSVERSNSIQLDLLEQLTIAQDALEKASKVVDFPLLKETEYRIQKYISSASETLLSDDEMQIYEFLENHLDPLLRNLLDLKPELKKVVENYLSALDPQKKIVYHHRKNYEESITRVNDILDRFIDQEQLTAQEIYPHYFERYITDGVEFNIYIGQSLSPGKPFSEIYVRNLKLWQLGFLAKAARLTHHLEKRLPLQLQTTQLILAQSIPLNISFRRKERKFDVDGAYNIRYEIVKKRIDKVHVRDSDERLTQPGTVAIVFSQQKELNEYLEYIEFLQNEKLLGEKIEHLELEDTQGISGLKAVRVDINFESDAAPTKEAYTKFAREQQQQN